MHEENFKRKTPIKFLKEGYCTHETRTVCYTKGKLKK